MKKKNIYMLIFLIIICILILSYSIIITDIKNTISNNTVTRVIDGDTFVLSSGETVRLLCINTPEKNQKGYNEAKEFLKELVINKNVRLANSTEDKDKFNRLLRFVYVNISENGIEKEVFVNKEIILNNFSELYIYNNTNQCKALIQD